METETFIHSIPRLERRSSVRLRQPRRERREMSLRVKSHTDLQAAGTPSLGGGLHQALSMSSGSLGRVPRFGSATTAAGEVRGHPAGRPRRPVRVVRPVSTNNSFLHMNNLQGELVRKRKVRKKGKELEIRRIIVDRRLKLWGPSGGMTGHLVSLASASGPSLTSITECCRKVETDTFAPPAPPHRKTGGAAVTRAKSLLASPPGQERGGAWLLLDS